MASKSRSRTLTDHEQIRQWAEERGAQPSAVRRTHSDDNVGIIRLDFPGYSGEGSLGEIEWDEWFENFDNNNLALVVQDETANGEQSNFNKLVSRENVENYSKETADGRSERKGSSSRRSTGTKTKSRGSRSSSRSASSEGNSGARGRSGSEKKKTVGRGQRTTGRKAA